MTEIAPTAVEAPRRFQFNWIPAVLLHPRSAFERIGSQSRSVWQTPLLVLSLTTLISVLVAGSIKATAAQMGGVALPPDFQYYTPEQQAQFMQAAQATSGPVFVYVFPAVAGLASIWIGWLLVGGLIHLALTLTGGRGDTGSAMNLVAWASLPFVLRDLVRIIAMLATKQLITSPGLSGFIQAEAGGWLLFVSSLLALVDIYIIWHFILLVIGARFGNGLSGVKAGAAVLVTLLLVLLLQALMSFLVGSFSSLTIVRPFFF